MMQNQKLCLKWNNHMLNMLSQLGGFQQKDMLVDVTISCQGQNIKAHKVILSACSPYFQSIFMENPCQHPIIIINGMKFEDVAAILNFMYKGEVNVKQDGLSSFLQAAEALKVKGLAEVCGEKSTNSISQDVQQSELKCPQRSDTPPRKRPRNRKRSLSDSNRSDDEGLSRKHREPSSPEVHELSGDESFTGDNSSNGPPFNSVPRVPQNVYSRSHQSSSNIGGEEDDDFEVEPTKMLEQNLTTDSNVSLNNSTSDNNLRIERIMGNATEIESSSLQEPESPPDIKPIINYGESSAGPSEGSLMLYNEQSQPGPSNMQDGSLLHDNSHAQDRASTVKAIESSMNKLQRPKGNGKVPYRKKYRTFVKQFKNGHRIFSFRCNMCVYSTQEKIEIEEHVKNLHKKKELPYRIFFRLLKNGHKIFRFRCKMCVYSTQEKKEIEEHVKNLHEKKVTFVKPTRSQMNNPAEKKKSQYYCDACKYSTSKQAEIVEHLTSHESEISSVTEASNYFRCCHCTFRTTVRLEMEHHLLIEADNRQHFINGVITEYPRYYSCDYCGTKIADLQTFELHRQYAHSNDYKCVICNKQFSNGHAFTCHRQKHNDETG